MKKIIRLFGLFLLIVSCKQDKKQSVENTTAVTAEHNEWIHLFDGESTDGWRAYNGEDMPSKWVIKDGELTFDTEKRTEEERKGGNLSLIHI